MAEQLLLVAIGFQAISQITSSISEASAVRTQGEFQAQRLRTEARLSELQARSAESRGRREEEDIQRKTKLLIGRQRALLAGQNVAIDTGTPLDLQLDAAEFGALDILTVRNNAFREATGHRIQAIDFRSQSDFAKLASQNRARNTIATGGISAASTNC